jgi:hypothetical protein
MSSSETLAGELYELLKLPVSRQTASNVPEMIKSLKFFMSSSDARVRFYAVRAVAAIAKDYRDEISDHRWISQTQRLMALGDNEGDLENAKILAIALSALIGTEISEISMSLPPRPVVTTTLFRLLPVVDSADDGGGGSGGGGCFFSVADISDRMASELQLALVRISGVISAFINADFLVLTTKGVSEISGNFMFTLRRVVEETSDHLFTVEEISDHHLETSTATATEAGDASYLDDDERFAAGRVGKNFPTFFGAGLASRGLAAVQRRVADLDIVEAPPVEVHTEAPAASIGSFFRRLFK